MVADAGAMIDRQLAHMAKLLDDLLDVSRITRGTLEIRQDTLDLRAAHCDRPSIARVPWPKRPSIDLNLMRPTPRCRYAAMKRVLDTGTRAT